MRLLHVAKPEEALSVLIRDYLKSHPVAETETVGILDSFGRILAENITAPEDVPSFARSTMD